MKHELEQVLSKNPKFLVDGVLNKNKLAELARQYSPDLLNQLSSNEKMTNHFFSKLQNGVLVFKKDIFLQFLNNKEFLPDSFTAYKTKIGLGMPDRNYLSENKEVVLNFPYKDCVLEGGQTKDDVKRQEVFFNETLAPTEINRLLDDKVLTNFKRYDETGEHNVEEIKDTDNLIIKGNNLIVLHSLKKRFAGKVKLIYIDPPYNTGNDSFNYNDSFNHSTWLIFMKNRLEVARELLSDDGLIFVQCDDNEQAYLKVLMDEVFSRNNFISNIVWKGRGGRQDSKYIAQIHETIIFYAKNKERAILNKAFIEDTSNYAYEDSRGNYKTQLIRKWGSNSRREDRPNLFYEVEFEGNKVLPILPNGDDGCWRWSKNRLEEAIKNDMVVSLEKDGRTELYEKIYKGDGKKQTVFTSWIDESFSGQGTKVLEEIFKEKVFDYPKPEQLVKKFIDLTTDDGDIVLDYHLGSGTTAAVAHKMNRQYIGIEQMDYIETVSVKRLEKVIEGEQGGISKSVDWQGGGSFVYCELKNDAQDFKNTVLEARESETLSQLFEQAKKSSFLSYRVDPKKLKKSEFEKLSLAEQKQVLLELVDNNNLYVNYSEIDDSDYGISLEEKKLNKDFYGEE
ncbi:MULTISPECIES: DNA methyltransferase [Streptococcus mitis group]|jgi:TYPE III RESTRICTION-MODIFICATION SYSTEM: METHYLASE|uniref:Site-specific DNA-methyltransferase n=2 Tax=Streptococcus mitis group TaxID=3409772 RepID=A0A387B8G0_9STRE|nr:MULTISPECIES: site-specific DNA-methyltransferase [Streptococcus]AYF95120.1 site-specific DNA-methyltransferase [Streptococcus gwangjuense]KEQ43516.1 DNA methylase family protein [Streptococcus mitis]MDU4515053.1 site-specific DNA-methyltransferase [Streptococcus mitis]